VIAAPKLICFLDNPVFGVGCGAEVREAETGNFAASHDEIRDAG
jgi:hypothetical protein